MGFKEAFRKSFSLYALYFALVDALCIFLLIFYEPILTFVRDSDLAYRYASTANPSAILVDSLPSDMALSYLWLWLKIIIITVVFFGIIVYCLWFLSNIVWNKLLGEKSSAHMRLYALSSLAHAVLFGTSLLIAWFVFLLIGKFFVDLTTGSPVEYIIRGVVLIGGYVVMLYLFYTSWLQQYAAHKRKTVRETMSFVLDHMGMHFVKALPILSAGVFAIVILASVYGAIADASGSWYFAMQTSVQFVSLGLALLYLGWARVFVTKSFEAVKKR